MSIPGQNLLKTALRVIKRQTVIYRRYTDRETNAIGYDIANYAAPRPITGSLQPVPRELYGMRGLDFQKNYFTFYTEIALLDIKRDVSGDRLEFCGKVFQVLSANDWINIDGWNGVLCVEIGGTDVR